MTSCCWLAESAACSPARRPRRRCDSASQPPWRYCFIQRFTALGWTPNTRAASAWVIPSSTAWTARLRSAAWAAPGRDRASSFDMPRAYDIPLYLPAGVITAGVVVLMLTLLHRSRLQAALRQCAAGLASTLRPYRTASGRYSRLGTGRVEQATCPRQRARQRRAVRLTGTLPGWQHRHQGEGDRPAPGVAWAHGDQLAPCWVVAPACGLG